MDRYSLSETDAAYIAGLVDGEGTITLTRKHRNENRQVTVSISNTDKYLLDFVRATVGQGKITRKRVTSARHTPSYTYAIYNRQALTLLEQISPYLKTYKSARCNLILRDYVTVTPRNGKYTHELKLARQEFEIAVLSIKPGMSQPLP